jgi:hypothetical protein
MREATAPRPRVLGHVRYVLGENPVTAFAFALFFLIVLQRR